MASIKKEKAENIPQKTFMNADYTNDLALLANTPTPAECLLQSQEQATSGFFFLS